ncbi:universal stress protein [Nocardia sp. 2YAB30]|uniref:universal stress protein n=1 Tax=unclassified Nocardia TaxID=2637762 RepID=UPI003F9DA590
MSDAAVEAAFREAALRKTDLVAVYAWSDPPAGRFTRLLESVEGSFDIAAVEQTVLAERLAGRWERFPEVVVRREVSRGIPRERLLEWSRAARLLVVGSRGRGVLAGMLLGPTGSMLVHRAECPVMVVHPPDRTG